MSANVRSNKANEFFIFAIVVIGAVDDGGVDKILPVSNFSSSSSYCFALYCYAT